MDKKAKRPDSVRVNGKSIPTGSVMPITMRDLKILKSEHGIEQKKMDNLDIDQQCLIVHLLLKKIDPEITLTHVEDMAVGDCSAVVLQAFGVVDQDF
jgi:hypothetical protein